MLLQDECSVATMIGVRCHQQLVNEVTVAVTLRQLQQL
jgi:hypothetical protein